MVELKNSKTPSLGKTLKCPLCDRFLIYDQRNGRWRCRNCRVSYNVEDGSVGFPILKKPKSLDSESEKKSASESGGCGDLVEIIKKNPSISSGNKERIIEQLRSD